MIMMSGLGFAQTPMEPCAQSLLSAFVSYTDLRLSSVQQSLEMLASTSEVNSAKWKNMDVLLSGYQKSDGGGLIVWFVRPDGSYYTVNEGLMHLKLSDRDYFPELMAGHKVIGSLVISKSTGQRSAVIAIPVKKGGKVIGAVGASVFLDKLSGQIAETLALPAEATFFALAQNGLTTLHKKTDRHFLDPRELGSETLKQAANEMLANPSGEVGYEFEGVAKKALYRTSPLTQWTFAIAFSSLQQK